MNGRERGKQLRDMIFKAYEDAQTVRQPTSVRPSSLGSQCNREPWMDYHWASPPEVFDGRKLRLFETGHSQEDRLIADIRRVGSDVHTRDPDDGSKQIPIATLFGHMNGFLDGAGSLIPFSIKEWLVIECKSHNDKSFKKLVADGMEVSKPEHYVQVQIYMHEHDLEECLYIAVNKNDDDLYCEFVQRNRQYHERIMAKAEMAAFSPRPPARVNDKPEFFLCKMCGHKPRCHDGELPTRTCRTCREAQPLKLDEMRKRAPQNYDDAGNLTVPALKGPPWWCNLHERPLSLDDQRAGCVDHRYNPGFVHGEELGDKDMTDGFAVIYKLKNGTEWVDLGPLERRKAPEFAGA